MAVHGNEQNGEELKEVVALHTLPVEIIYDIHLYGLSSHIRHVSRRLYAIMRDASTRIHAMHILSGFEAEQEQHRTAIQQNPSTGPPRAREVADILNFALSSPFCSQGVLDAVLRISQLPNRTLYPPILPYDAISFDEVYFVVRLEYGFGRGMWHPNPWHEAVRPLVSLPKRVFKSSSTTLSSQQMKILAYVLYIYSVASEFGLEVNTKAKGCRALIHAIEPLDLPLVELLLETGAINGNDVSIALKITTSKGDERVIKLLVDAEGPDPYLKCGWS